jgi:hypothetical protein
MVTSSIKSNLSILSSHKKGDFGNHEYHSPFNLFQMKMTSAQIFLVLWLRKRVFPLYIDSCSDEENFYYHDESDNADTSYESKSEDKLSCDTDT